MSIRVVGEIMEKDNIMLKVPLSETEEMEISLEDVCDKECRKLCSFLYMIEEEFDTDMRLHPDLRKHIIDSSRFIRRIPIMVSEIVRCGK